MRTASFLGKGIAFPFRVNPNTGGVQTTTGLYDGTSVALEFLDDRVTIREQIDVAQNHVAESIANILLTQQGEDDTLPEFGSNISYLVFEKASIQFKLASEAWFTYATKRWEHRAEIPENGGVTWKDTAFDISQNVLPLSLAIYFILHQTEKNLVYPFITPREAIEAEYLPSGRDTVGYDSFSRYYPSRKVASSRGTYTYFRNTVSFTKYTDDSFYEVMDLDTWRSISYKQYGETRYWWVVAKASAEYGKESGRGRSALNYHEGPNIGDILRLPSKERLIMR